MSFALSHPIRTVLRWQLLATALAIAVLGWFAGTHGAISAALGGAISIMAGLAAAWFALRKPAADPATAVASALIAEGLKVFLIVAGLAAVFLVVQECRGFWLHRDVCDYDGLVLDGPFRQGNIAPWRPKNN